MCLAIWKPEGKEVPEKFLKAGMDGNSDGAGIAYPEDGKLSIHKGWFKFETFHEAYSKLGDRAMLIHFRQKTHGEATADNCHPFRIDEHHALIHNGILNINTEKGESDTWRFTEAVMKPLFAGDPELWQTNHGKYLISMAIGRGNKVLVMNSSGVAVIYNEDIGHWKDGVWYSNSGYLGKGMKNACRVVRGYSHGGFSSEFYGHGGVDASEYYHMGSGRAVGTPDTENCDGTKEMRGTSVAGIQKTADGEGWEPVGTLGTKVDEWFEHVRTTLYAMHGFTIRDYTQLRLDYGGS